MTEEVKTLPSRLFLIQQLQKLRDFSAYNETLTRKITGGEETMEVVRSDIENCVGEQSKIVDLFLSLSEDQSTITKFKETVKSIEDLTAHLDTNFETEEIFQLREKILHAIEEWTSCLETIITGVIVRAQE
jgi:hypothetical protein